MNLRNQIKKSILSGVDFLREHCFRGRFPSFWSYDPDMSSIIRHKISSKDFSENFSSIIIGECLLDFEKGMKMSGGDMTAKILGYLASILNPRNPLIGFFRSKAARENFPPDGDDSCFCASEQLSYGVTRENFLKTEKMVWENYVPEIRDFYLYFGEKAQSRKSKRTDPIGTINMITFLGQMQMGGIDKLQQPINKIFEFLNNKDYLKTSFSFYYHEPIIFLYFLGRMIEILQLPFNKECFIKRVEKVVDRSNNPLVISMSVTSVARFEEVNLGLLLQLLGIQDVIDGGWPIASIFRLGRDEDPNGVRNLRYFGSRSITTALVIQALSRSLELL